MALYIIIQSIVIYLTITMILYVSARLTLQTKSFKYLLAGLFLYSLIFGLRYGVGRDCNSYIETYQAILRGVEDNSHEAGFMFLMKSLAYLGANSFFFLFTTSFIPIFFVFYTFKDRLGIIPYLTLTFMLGCVWLSFSNGIRQEIAFSIFIYALYQLSKGKNVQYLLFILLASTIHTSALILLLIYPIFHIFSNKWIPKIKVQILLIIIALYIGQTPIIINSLDLITDIVIASGYDIYLESEFIGMLVNENDSIGIGFIIQLFLCIVLVYNSKYLNRENKYLMFIFFLYFIGIIYKYIFISSLVLQRVNYYFYGYEFILGAMLIYKLKKINRLKNYYLILSLYILYFSAILYRMFDNSSAFYFIWDS